MELTKYEKRVLDHMEQHGSINQKTATDEYGNRRLSATIWKLRHKYGYEIDGAFESGKNKFGEPVVFKNYFLKQ